MEPEAKVYCCYDNKPKKKCKGNKCLAIITVILLTIFAAALGLLIGAIASTGIMAAMAAVIVFVVTFGILLILSIILYFCQKKKCNKEK